MKGEVKVCHGARAGGKSSVVVETRVLEALRAGCTTKRQIRRHLSISESACHRAVNTLVDAGVVEQVTPDVFAPTT